MNIKRPDSDELLRLIKEEEGEKIMMDKDLLAVVDHKK
jgi:hypothetical protein